MDFKKVSGLFIVVVAVILIMGSLMDTPDANPVSATQGQLLTKKIDAPSLKNNMIDESLQQEITVFLPKSYEETKKNYPVVYFLPGYDDSFVNYGHVVTRGMSQLIANKKINEMIVVTVNGRNKLKGSFYVNSPVTGNWEDFVVQDVVTYMDENFRTIKQAGSRGIAGHSMGGFGAISIAMHHPEIFGYVYSMSPGLFAAEGIGKINLDFSVANSYAGKSKQEARAEYIKEMNDLRWPKNFSFAYGSAFAPDPEGDAPYIKKVSVNSLQNSNYSRDGAWKAWNAGFGEIADKVDSYETNLKKLKDITIEYGSQDEFAWIPEGCQAFSEELTKKGIKHKLISFEGNHHGQTNDRLIQEVLPFFSDRMSFEE
jgi:enterochelin esterase-like enzyme